MKNYFIINEALFNIGQISMSKAFLPEPGHDYDIVTQNGKRFLRQLAFKNWKDHEVSTEAFSKNKNCIIDLMRTTNFSTTINWNNCSKYINEEILFKWCYKYGLPERVDQNGRTFIESWPSIDYDPLCIHIIQMRCMFNLWLGLINKDIDNTIKNISLIADCPTLKYKVQSKNGDEVVISLKSFGNLFRNADELTNLTLQIGNDFEKAKYLSCCIIETILDRELYKSCWFQVSSPYLTDNLNINSPLFEITPYCELIDLCYYQLFAIINNREGAKHLKECANPECKNNFWCHHKGQKYCPNCDRRTVWHRNKELKKEKVQKQSMNKSFK